MRNTQPSIVAIPMHSMIEMIQGTQDLTCNMEKLPIQSSDSFEEINAKV